MRGRRGRISDDARPSTLSRLARHGWATSQRRGGRCGGEQRVQRRGGRRVNEGESVRVIRVYQRCQIGERTVESTERVRWLQRTGLGFGRGRLNFGAAENNFKTKPGG